jgi:WD40 repeat protein
MQDHCLIGWRAGDGWVRDWTVSTADLAVYSVTLSADGRRLAMLTRVTLGNRQWWVDRPMQVEVRDAANGAVLATSPYPYNYAQPLLFSPDTRLLVGRNDMTLLVWEDLGEAALGPPRLVRNDNRKHFTAMAFHPSGRHLFVTSNDTTVHVFDTLTWARARRLTWNVGRLKAVAVSPDGHLAAAGGHTGNVVIWDLD